MNTLASPTFSWARIPGRLRFGALVLAYAALVLASLYTFAAQGDLSMGRNPWSNLAKTAQEFAKPSFVDVWFGNPRLEYRSDDGTVLRVEDRRAVEASYLHGLVDATWTTVRIATLGSLLAALLALRAWG
jgi:ABC-type phosphate/phosphonate transport system permease subunit